MSSVVLLFSGQGAQRVGMGRDFYDSSPEARALFEKAAETLPELQSVMFDGPDEQLTRTSFCQPALYLHGLVALEMLKLAVPNLDPVAAAGLSLGEFTAHAAAGSFDFNTGLNIVAQRGRFMEEACEATDGSMAAMIGGDEEAVKKLAEDTGVDVANFNAPGQIVLSGSVAGIDQAVAQAKERGIRMAKKLNVAGAYHSSLMQSAQEKLAATLASSKIDAPGIQVVCNYAAVPVATPNEVRSMAEKQVTGSVRWTESMKFLIDRGHTRFVELGPGKVLAGLMGRIDKSVEVISVEDLPSLEAAAEKLND